MSDAAEPPAAAVHDDAPPAVPATTIDPFTVLFNAVEVANRRGAYSLKESSVISRAMEMVRAMQATPAAAQDPDDAPGGEAAAMESVA